MIRLIFILILGVHSIAFGQVSFTGQVFILSKDFMEDICEVTAQCDCCASDLFFLSADKFAFVSRCLSGDVYTTGTYSYKNNKLKLVFLKKYVEEETDEQYNVIGYKHSEVDMPPLEFEVVRCGQKIRLIQAKDTEWKNGSRYELLSEKERLKQLRESIAWKQLSK
ncbi:MAG: hypothetical protein HYZ44_14645 [Bacteroidetes bacterium]|nr:hypothetical protein [Bacteroidota bacterium]